MCQSRLRSLQTSMHCSWQKRPFMKHLLYCINSLNEIWPENRNSERRKSPLCTWRNPLSQINSSSGAKQSSQQPQFQMLFKELAFNPDPLRFPKHPSEFHQRDRSPPLSCMQINLSNPFLHPWSYLPSLLSWGQTPDFCFLLGEEAVY